MIQETLYAVHLAPVMLLLYVQQLLQKPVLQLKPVTHLLQICNLCTGILSSIGSFNPLIFQYQYL